MNLTKLIAIGAAALLLIVGGFMAVEIKTVPGGQVGVLQTWDGIEATPQFAKTYTLIPAFTKEIHTYDVTSKTLKVDNYVVQSKDSQDMKIDFTVAYHLDPAKVPELHKSAGRDYESILQNRLFSIVKDEATIRTALQAYSGSGLVDLQVAIEKSLQDPKGELVQRGFVVENFVIIHIGLDPKYTEEITQRQIAIQTQLRAVEQTKAATALAEKAKADAQADYEKQLVEARRDKEKGVLAAEQRAQQEVIAAKASAEQVVLKAQADAKQVELKAEADRKQVVLAAEGEKEAGLLKAAAIEALGAAEAEAQKLRLSAYAVPGVEAFARIEVAKSFALGMSNIKGVVPADFKLSVFSKDFTQGVNVMADTK
jgi:regulator of protease activity HflC (stomatin/prohibitin superfamily)